MASGIGIIILAAGSSSRLGKPKQLLLYNGLSLLKNTVDAAVNVADSTVVVVIGANSDVVASQLQNADVTMCHNPDWEQGMGSSIHVGLSELLLHNPGVSACIIAVCDQPFVSTEIFNNLIHHYQTSGAGIVASAYAGTLGTPVLFSNSYFSALLQLKGEEGAKKLLQLYKDDVASVPFKNGAIDIDTQHDYDNLVNNKYNL